MARQQFARAARRQQLSRTAARRAAVAKALSTKGSGRKAKHPMRIGVGRILLITALAITTLKLVQVQAIEGPALANAAAAQRLTGVTLPAQRGNITDVNGTKLAFSVDSRALSARPRANRGDWDQAQRTQAQAAAKSGHTYTPISYDDHAKRIAAFLAQQLGPAVNEGDLENKLRSDTTFFYIDEQVTPEVAHTIVTAFPEIAQEKRSVREYPAGAVGSNVVGVANWRKDQVPPGTKGLIGLESALNKKLAGQDGRQYVDTGSGSNVVIPGTERDVSKAVPGENVQLTIDSDVQFKAQQLLDSYRDKVKAQNGSLAVLDVKTGQIVALANDKSFDPNDLAHAKPDELGDAAITSPFEPGSVGKMITAAGAMENGVVKPDSVISVPGQIKVADRTIHDDWSHPTENFTFTGILAKSSNVGTLKVAQRMGPEAFNEYLKKFGMGHRTGVALPGESSGRVPPLKDWSGSTFGNLPFGQGYSMTVLQMASAYQAIANKGVRIPPRVIKSTSNVDGTVTPNPQPPGVKVVSPKTADQLVAMLRSVTQKGGMNEQGTAPSAALDGYQVAGKTGTAQQFDPKLGRYSDTKKWVTFAGILPADHPRFVAAIMLDRPAAPNSEGGDTAAPLFHDLASFLTQRYNLPLSAGPTPNMKFVLP